MNIFVYIGPEGHSVPILNVTTQEEAAIKVKKWLSERMGYDEETVQGFFDPEDIYENMPKEDYIIE